MTRVLTQTSVARPLCALIISITAAYPLSTQAQFAVFDATSYAEIVQQYGKAVQAVREAQTQVQNQVIALKKLTNPQSRNVGGAWSTVDATMTGGQGIVYGQSAPVSSLQGTFPGEVASRQYVPERTAQVAKTLATAAAVLGATQAQGTTYGAGRQQIAAMQSQVGTIQGHEQALELQNTVGLFGANEAMLTRQAIEGQTNLQAVYYAQQVNDQAQAEANARQLYQSMGSRAGVRRALVSFQPTP